MKLKIFILLLVFVSTLKLQAQEDKEAQLRRTEAKAFAVEAQNAMANNEFEKAEAKYREAISKDPDNAELKYNLGTVYFNKEKNQESVSRLNQSAKIAESKSTKHKSFHNQGNAFMKEEKYGEAVEAYKNALRNDPTDDETRYNLAVAKEKAKQQQQDQEKEKDKDQEEKEDQENKDEKGDNKEDKEKNEEKNKDQEGDQGKDQEKGDDQQKQEKKEGEGDQEKEQPDQQQQKDEGDKGKEQSQQPVKGQMSPQQMKNLLEAMENQEKEIQDKINARRAKGQQKTTDKDW
ncbi:TPR repeat-containing protein [Mesonia phycicola]|uniref:TPR repeat-containing protein n=1 Tax=Mesonia phycicola TaxID=579105 RepID=A0A1M6CU97_9FLAO|nr:tetratricopeptide repeat protein [Mesonia phycicola]SHI64592.1 TPR repeat-containing protein [Mesonia phycicola]